MRQTLLMYAALKTPASEVDTVAIDLTVGTTRFE